MSKFNTNSLVQSMLSGLLVIGATTAVISCDAPNSKEDLNPEGPPMVRQVLATEQLVINDAPVLREGQLAFGSHAAAFFEEDDGVVVTAIATGSQEVRVILDELVRGNTLEEVACADGSFSRIPNGTTPDDIADCAGPVDALTRCTKVCIGGDGAPLGVLDADDDGAADDFRMIDYNPDPDVTELGVSLVCDSVSVPLDPETSFWSPSGNQTFPSNNTLSFRGIGPAIVLKPVADIGLRTGAICSVTFRPEVVDYDDNVVCAPTGGIPAEGCSGSDTSKIAFNTEVLTVKNSVPIADATNVALADSMFILAAFNANLDATTVSAISLTAGGVAVTINPIIQEDDTKSFLITLDNDFLPNTDYELTISTDLKDLLGGAMLTPTVIKWTTGAAGNAAPMITPPADQNVGLGVATAALDVTISDAETAVAALVLTATSSNQALVDAAGIEILGTTGVRTITISPKAGVAGTTIITLTVSDGTTTTNATFNVTAS